MAVQHSELRARATVSVWLGDFRTEGDLDEYMREDFSSHFGFTYEPAAGPESHTHPGEPISVRELLSGFSQSHRFLDEAVRAALQHGRTVANAAVVFFATRYDLSLASAVSPPLQFIGAIDLTPWE